MEKAGFEYLGPGTVYFHLQVCGMGNDHDKNCDCYKRIISQFPTIRKRRYKEKRRSGWQDRSLRTRQKMRIQAELSAGKAGKADNSEAALAVPRSSHGK